MSLDRAVALAESGGWIDPTDRARFARLAVGVPLSGPVLLDELGVDGELADRLGGQGGEGDFGRYQVLRSLGEGGMGSVFLARDQQLGREVALKLMHTTLVSERQRRRFQREAAVMARLKHPACVDVFDVGVTGRGEPFLVMEYVKGQNLQEVLRDEGPADQRLVARWGRDLAEALEACHAEGVLHRDVKPSNVLLTPDGNVRLTDFGVAHDAQANTQLTQGAVGTLLYMAPELLDGVAPTPASEVYALGATLYELLSGAPPFPGPSHLELLRQVAGTEPQSLVTVGVHSDLNQVLLKCLIKNPAGRYPSAREAALDLGRFLAGVPVLARAQSPAIRLLRHGWRKRRAILVSLLTFTVGVAFLFGYLHLEELNERRAAQRQLSQAEGILDSADVDDSALVQAAALVSAGRQSPFREDQEWGEHLERRVTGLRLLRRAKDGLLDHRAIVNRLIHLARPIEHFQPTTPALLRKLIASEVEGAQIEDLYAKHLRAYVAVDRLLGAAEQYLGAGGVEPVARQLELQSGAALSEYWPVEAERHFVRATEFGEQGTVPPPPEIHLLGVGHGTLATQAGETVEFTLPALLRLKPLRYTGAVKSSGNLPFRLAMSLRRGEDRTVRLPSVRLEEVPVQLREDLVGVVGGSPRVGLHLRRVSQNVPTFLLLRTEVPRAISLSYLIWALGKAGTPGLSANAAREARTPVFESNSLLAPCVGLDWSDIYGLLRWLEGEFQLVGSPFQLRLLHPLEYHQALRADFLWRFPWGKALDVEQFFRQWSDIAVDKTDVSPFGVCDLAGSVSELCHGEARSKCVVGSWDGASLATQLYGTTSASGYYGRPGGDQTVGFRFVVDITEKQKIPWKQSLPRSLELQAKAQDLLAKGNYREAYYTATDSLRAYRKNVESWTIRAEAKLVLGDAWGAWWDCAQVLELDPDNANPRMWGIYAHAIGRSQRWEKAIPICTRALELVDWDPSLFFRRGQAYAQLGQHAKAVADLTTYLERMPKAGNRSEALDLIQAAKAALANPEPSKEKQ